MERALVSLASAPLMDCPHGSVTPAQIPQLHIFFLDGLGWLLVSLKIRIPGGSSQSEWWLHSMGCVTCDQSVCVVTCKVLGLCPRIVFFFEG